MWSLQAMRATSSTAPKYSLLVTYLSGTEPVSQSLGISKEVRKEIEFHVDCNVIVLLYIFQYKGFVIKCNKLSASFLVLVKQIIRTKQTIIFFYIIVCASELLLVCIVQQRISERKSSKKSKKYIFKITIQFRLDVFLIECQSCFFLLCN